MSDTQSASGLRPASYSLLELARSVKRSLGTVIDIWRYRALVNAQSPSLPVRSILVVCKGNICRSPLAEAYLKHLALKQGLATTVRSAGLETTSGKPAHPLARLVGEQSGLQLDGHITQPLHKEQVDWADVIIVMEWQQRTRLLRLYPQAEQKVFLLRQFYDQSVREVADPYSGTMKDFQICFAMIQQACDVLVKTMPVAR